jgi:hypothetical protein
MKILRMHKLKKILIEVCNHCYTFRDDSEVEKKNHFIAIPKFFGDIKPGFASDLQQELLAGIYMYM